LFLHKNKVFSKAKIANMEISGKIVKINEPISGKSARGDWKKQEVIIETEEQYPRQVCLYNWNDKADISKLKPNDKITASINIESREYNDRWFTDVKIWKLEATTSSAPSNSGSVPPPEIPAADDPFGGSSDSEDDGLPF
jgi:hypothetical protein